MTEQTGLTPQALLFDVTHHFGGGVYAKETRIKAGTVLVQHRHVYDHLSVLASGEAVVIVEGTEQRYTAPACVTVRAGAHHAVKALTDIVWYCIHATECTNPDEVDEVLVAKEQSDMQAIARQLV